MCLCVYLYVCLYVCLCVCLCASEENGTIFFVSIKIFFVWSLFKTTKLMQTESGEQFFIEELCFLFVELCFFFIEVTPSLFSLMKWGRYLFLLMKWGCYLFSLMKRGCNLFSLMKWGCNLVFDLLYVNQVKLKFTSVWLRLDSEDKAQVMRLRHGRHLGTRGRETTGIHCSSLNLRSLLFIWPLHR